MVGEADDREVGDPSDQDHAPDERHRAHDFSLPSRGEVDACFRGPAGGDSLRARRDARDRRQGQAAPGSALQPRRLGAAGPRDPLAILAAQDETRVPELVPIRYGRMLASPFAFFRGAAAVMAADLGATPTHRARRSQLCGDAHLSNFGVFAAPDRRLVFDFNDFDETCPGPFEWDVKRLAASFAVAGRERGFGERERRRAVLAAAAGYREAMRELRRDAQPRRLVRADRRRAGARRARARRSTSARCQQIERDLAKAQRQGQPARPAQADPTKTTASCGSSATRR